MSISFGSMPQRSGTWTWFKGLVASKHLLVQYEQDAVLYSIYGYDSPEVCTCVIYKGTVPPSVAETYSQAQNDVDKTEFETFYLPKANRSNTTNDGRSKIALEKSDAKKVTVCSHDWTDPTTWYTAAVRVVDEIASCLNPGTYTQYDLSHVNVIDSYHGRITQEDFLKDANNYSYRVAVKVNNQTKVEQDPHYGTGGDFTLNYATGVITFLSALDAEAEVKVTYHYATTSIFYLRPQAGKTLKLMQVEAQFASDIEITDSITFQPYGLVEVFAPQLMPGIPSGTKIPLGDPLVYKTMTDYQNDSVKSYPSYPAMGGNTWRGAPLAICPFDWDYVTSTPLISDYGMEIRVKLEHDQPFSGWYATATFYCSSEDS